MDRTARWARGPSTTPDIRPPSYYSKCRFQMRTGLRSPDLGRLTELVPLGVLGEFAVFEVDFLPITISEKSGTSGSRPASYRAPHGHGEKHSHGSRHDPPRRHIRATHAFGDRQRKHYANRDSPVVANQKVIPECPKGPQSGCHRRTASGRSEVPRATTLTDR